MITVKQNGQPMACDLTTKAGVTAFVRSLDLPPDRTAGLEEVFNDFYNQGNALDELAQIAQVWARAERGGTIPSRMVISGHGHGDGFWGTNNGTISDEVSACNGGRSHSMQDYREAFPNLKTITGYVDSAPGAAIGAINHMRIWERQTRGAGNVDPEAYRHTRKGDHIATWDTVHGGRSNTPQTRASAADQMFHLAVTEPDYDDYFLGNRHVTDLQSGFLRQRYNQIQDLINSPDLGAAEADEWRKKGQITLKLLHYAQSIAPRFASEYKEELKSGYDSLGLK